MNKPHEALHAEPPELDWAELNQRWLAQQFVRLLQRLQPQEEVDAASLDAQDHLKPPGALDASQFEPALQRLARLFGLSRFESELLLLCAGAECDAPLRAALAALDPGSTGGVSFALALQELDGAHWDALSPTGPLRHWQLLQVNTETGLGQARLRVNERVLHHLTGVAAFDDRLQGLARLLRTDGPQDPPLHADSEAQADAAAAALAEFTRPLLLFHLAPDATQQRRAARTLALTALRRLPLHALWVDTGALDPEPRALADCARALDREAALSGAAIVLSAGPHAGSGGQDASEAGAALLRLIRQLRSPLLLLGALSAAELAELPERRCWRCALPEPQASSISQHHPVLRRALQQFRVDDDTALQALASLPANPDGDAEAGAWQALRVASRGGLELLAQRISSRTRLADLVLPASALDSLRTLLLQLRHREQVHGDWGFEARGSRGLGLAALFAGESGTGKTYAAEALANEAGLDLYRIDLALVVSKYIGETEKNLRRLFDAAESSGAVLLFDEADALFGKRSEVKDSHDRYANIEVSYLLQRVESYRGLALLTTNLKSALDRAFLRRLRCVVHFPFPDEAAREQLWRRQFPPQAPLADDVDWRALARLHLTGGHIHAVALNAAFRAAAEGAPIGKQHLLDAARAEYQKLERSFGSAGVAA